MQTENIVPLMEQIKALKNPALHDVINQTPKVLRPEKIRDLVIRHEGFGNSKEAEQTLELLWPSILQGYSGTKAVVHCAGGNPPSTFSFNRSQSIVVGVNLIDEILETYAKHLEVITQRVFDQDLRQSGFVEKVGTEILQSAHLMHGEKAAVDIFNMFLCRFVGEKILLPSSPQLYAVRPDKIVRQSLEKVTEGIILNDFFAKRISAYIRASSKLSEGSNPFMQLREQAEMLAKINRVFGIELIKRMPAKDVAKMLINHFAYLE